MHRWFQDVWLSTIAFNRYLIPLFVICSYWKQNLLFQVTVPLCTHKKKKTTHRLLHTMLVPHRPWLRCMFCSQVIVGLKWAGISCATQHVPEQLWRDKTQMCAYSPNPHQHPDPPPKKPTTAFMFNTFKMNPTSPTQTDKHCITFITSALLNVIWSVWPVWVCNIAETLSWKTCRHQNLYIRWSLKRAKCTVCLSSVLFRGNLTLTWHTQ